MDQAFSGQRPPDSSDPGSNDAGSNEPGLNDPASSEPGLVELEPRPFAPDGSVVGELVESVDGSRAFTPPLLTRFSSNMRDRFWLTLRWVRDLVLGLSWSGFRAWARSYFVNQDPVFWVAITPALLLAALVFVRNPTSNYIFDEQEALLANPYVNGKDLGWLAAFSRDFWGLPPNHSIGSYRPLPNLIWRVLWHVSELPWLHHWVNVVVHAVNAALFSGFVFSITRRRNYGWLAGLCFLLSSVVTEAITGVVGIADVLGGLGTVLALHALRAPWWGMFLGVFASLLLALFSKESALVAIPLVPWVAWVAAPAFHPGRAWRWLRTPLALLATVLALVAYTQVRRTYFPVALPADLEAPASPTDPWFARLFHQFLQWFQQPRLPADPINNPLTDASFPYRLAGALRVYWRGLVQVVFPWTLSGDYSFPQEPIPEKLIFPESVLGGLGLFVAPVVGLVFWLRTLWLRTDREWRGWDLWSIAMGRHAEGEPVPVVELIGPDPRRWNAITASTLLAIGLIWVPVAYFPHSNIPVVLPTVRAERFWYLPVLGTALVLTVLLAWVLERLTWKSLGFWGERWRTALGPVAVEPGLLMVGLFLGFQALCGRLHALDYTDDLAFWDSTRRAAPNSAKAHLNYSVMVGARGRLPERLLANGRALELAPKWPMAHVYYGDTLCRLNRVEEAWPHYVKGWKLAPNDSNLIALALQCLWDNGAIPSHKEDLLKLADAPEFAGSWLAYLARDIVNNGTEYGGVDRKYRPRGYNEGPKN